MDLYSLISFMPTSTNLLQRNVTVFKIIVIIFLSYKHIMKWVKAFGKMWIVDRTASRAPMILYNINKILQ